MKSIYKLIYITNIYDSLFSVDLVISILTHFLCLWEQISNFLTDVFSTSVVTVICTFCLFLLFVVFLFLKKDNFPNSQMMIWEEKSLSFYSKYGTSDQTLFLKIVSWKASFGSLSYLLMPSYQ